MRTRLAVRDRQCRLLQSTAITGDVGREVCVAENGDFAVVRLDQTWERSIVIYDGKTLEPQVTRRIKEIDSPRCGPVSFSDTGEFLLLCGTDDDPITGNTAGVEIIALNRGNLETYESFRLSTEFERLDSFDLGHKEGIRGSTLLATDNDLIRFTGTSFEVLPIALFGDDPYVHDFSCRLDLLVSLQNDGYQEPHFFLQENGKDPKRIVRQDQNSHDPWSRARFLGETGLIVFESKDNLSLVDREGAAIALLPRLSDTTFVVDQDARNMLGANAYSSPKLTLFDTRTQRFDATYHLDSASNLAFAAMLLCAVVWSALWLRLVRRPDPAILRFSGPLLMGTCAVGAWSQADPSDHYGPFPFQLLNAALMAMALPVANLANVQGWSLLQRLNVAFFVLGIAYFIPTRAGCIGLQLEMLAGLLVATLLLSLAFGFNSWRNRSYCRLEPNVLENRQWSIGLLLAIFVTVAIVLQTFYLQLKWRIVMAEGFSIAWSIAIALMVSSVSACSYHLLGTKRTKRIRWSLFACLVAPLAIAFFIGSILPFEWQWPYQGTMVYDPTYSGWCVRRPFLPLLMMGMVMAVAGFVDRQSERRRERVASVQRTGL